MKFILIILLIFSPCIFCKNEEEFEYDSTDSPIRQDCAKGFYVLEKCLAFREEFSKELSRVENKHAAELANVRIKHAEELAKVYKHQSELTLELAETKVKQSEKLAAVEVKHSNEINSLKDEVAKAKTNCTEEGKSMKTFLNDALREVTKEVEEKHEILKSEVLNVKTDSTEKLETFKEEVGDAKNNLTSEIMSVKSKNTEIETTLNERSMAIFSVFSNKTETLSSNSFIGFDYHFVENRGMNNFDLKNGFFKAPFNGLYEFAFSGHSNNNQKSYIQVLKNGLEINEFRISSGYNNLSPSWVCYLEKLDTVRLKLSQSTPLYTDENMYRVFSGKLLSQWP